MSSATVPAWKRLGLKLKQPAAGPDPAASSPASASPAARPASVGHLQYTPKRKLDAHAPPGPADDSPKRARREDPRNAGAGPQRHMKSKSVSFGDTPTKADLNNSPSSSSFSHQPASSSAARTKSPLSKQQTNAKESAKKIKGPAKKQKPQPPLDLTAALEYLRQWKTSRDTWKFNKNHQSALIKHVFDDKAIPTADIAAFYEYIRDLKGYTRTRLRETAMEVKAHDQAIGAKGFPAGTKDIEAKQSTYENMLADFFGPPPTSNKRKVFDEGDYIATSEDADVIIRRVIKRMRAELILDDLSDSGETDHSTTSTTNTTSAASSETITGSETNLAAAESLSEGKALGLNGPTGKRRRKLRTAVDDSSSDESDSDDDSDSSSDDSSSDGSDDEDDEEPKKKSAGYESDSSSSSSSSSSGGDDSDSDAESEDEL